VSLRSAATISYQLERLSEYLGPNTLLTAITPAMLTAYHRRRVGDGIKEHSANREIVILRAALQHAHNIHGQQIAEIQWSKVRKPEPPGRTRFLSREEYDALMRAAHEALRPIILCAVATGLREGNILDMDWRQVKLGERLIQMRVKGNKQHAVRITPALLAALSTMPRRSGLVFDRTNFRRRWVAAVKAAGLEDFKFHDLRHTFASWARQAGADIADVCEALGHSDISMTMRYAHIKPDAHDTAFDRVSAAMMAQSTAQIERKA
jgi:integrase